MNFCYFNLKKKSFVLKMVALFLILAILFNLGRLIKLLKEKDEDWPLENNKEKESIDKRKKEDNYWSLGDDGKEGGGGGQRAVDSPDYDLAYQNPRELSHVIAEAEKLYLNEKYLRAMKLGQLHSDSKMAVDRATKRPLDECLRALDALDLNNATAIRSFVDTYMYEPGVEIVKANLTDWSPLPKYVFELKSPALISFALGINQIWNDLFKRVDLSKLTGGRVSSHLPMKHGFVVPGGRFLEIYYWDSYWTMEGSCSLQFVVILEPGNFKTSYINQGLLVSGMFETAKRTLDNFIAFIEQFGFIPNGSRIYYLNRSHPPFFAHMLDIFYDFVSQSTMLDSDAKRRFKRFVLDEGLSAVIREYEFWMTNRSVEVKMPDSSGSGSSKTVRLNIYRANTDRPRPESFFEDINSVGSKKKLILIKKYTSYFILLYWSNKIHYNN